MLVDSHCHLNFPEFAEDLSGVVARAAADGVGVLQTICTKLHEFDAVHAIAQAYDDVYCSVGVHPHEVENAPLVEVEALEALAGREKVIGIGETGLDYYYEHSPRAMQQESFRRHIDVSRRTGLPVIIHTRAADEDTIAILEEEQAKGAFPGVIHCFSTGREVAEAAIRHGMLVSLSGILTFKKSDDLRAIARELPLESLLVETDAPFLAPVPYRGKRNEPAWTRHVAECLAELKGVSIEKVEKVTTENFFRVFTRADG